ncbi:MAG TPA: hypothetical protein DIW31_02440 [Bacteroidales bacterium]|nr:hypothetical protein [Bacteroidales bacterium]
MLLKSFYINIIIRILAILASCLAIAACMIWKPDWLIIINLALLVALQIVLLILKITRLNKDLESFFAAMQSNDSSIVFTGKKKKSPFISLYEQLEKINSDFQHLKIQNHRQNEYFKILVEHINIGILSFNDNDEITLFNRAGKEILGKRYLHNINELENTQIGLSTIIKELEPINQKLITLYTNNSIQQLSLRTAWIKFEDNSIKLVSFQNIRNELDEKELESWQKLIRVLTHELMNSAGPINSTIATIKEFLTFPNGEAKPVNNLNKQVVDDTVEGLRIIEERSQGMMDFVSKFRSLTLLPKPTFTTFAVGDLFKTIELLMADKIASNNITFISKISTKNLSITADKGMMEQILINLVSNAIYALENRGDKKITISSITDDNAHPIIQIQDNGKGIPIDVQDKIFVPFFTTRNEGSGVGLSLSRQLVRLLGGTLTFVSKEGEGTIFTIKL